MSTARDDRLYELARRVLAGEAIDWDAAMREDPAVVAELRRLQLLVVAGGDSTGTASAPPPDPPVPPPPPAPPKRSREDRFIGDFRLVRTLGEGGMGVVYEAEQQHPRRPVALKVIRGGSHVGPDTLKLFQREAQTLARLRHPGIAALYETGVTDDGLHFFAMELVRGPTLSAWIRQRPAGPITPDELRLRLSVFKKICDAVAYAHQRGVIHRDLKPGNVLIPKQTSEASFHDSVPDVKVLDFGLARITDSDVQATTYVTEMGKVQGTLPYMSPEQVRGNPDEIDLRTDVYSLGVLLYEMVTGRLPLDVSKAQLPEAVRIICEEAPKSISATFTGTKHLHADVITIAGKCLEKEPSRRYQSAAALGEDVGRYLSDQPILARPPSAAYQIRKLISRHKLPFAFAATVFALVMVLAVSSTHQAFRIAKERDRANQEAETAKQVSEFLEGLFKVSDPSESRGNTITAREILDQGAERIAGELKEQPAVQATLLLTIGRTYQKLSLHELSEPLLLKALEIRSDVFGEDSLEAAETMSALAWGRMYRGIRAECLEMQNRALQIHEARLPRDDPRTAHVRYFYALALYQDGRLEEARDAYESALTVIRAKEGEEAEGVIWCHNDLGNVFLSLGDPERALQHHEAALAIRRRTLDPKHPDLAIGLNNVAELLGKLGRYERARRLAEESVAIAATSLGTEHGWYGYYLAILADIERRAGNLSAAERAMTVALPVCQRFFDRTSTWWSEILLIQALVLRDVGRLQESEELFKQLLPLLEDVRREGGAGRLVGALQEYSKLLRMDGRSDAAEEAEARAKEVREMAART